MSIIFATINWRARHSPDNLMSGTSRVDLFGCSIPEGSAGNASSWFCQWGRWEVGTMRNAHAMPPQPPKTTTKTTTLRGTLLPQPSHSPLKSNNQPTVVCRVNPVGNGGGRWGRRMRCCCWRGRIRKADERWGMTIAWVPSTTMTLRGTLPQWPTRGISQAASSVNK